jgi:type I restriction enzyme S subunit
MSEELGVTSGWIEIEFGDLFTLPNDDIVDGPFGSNLKASEYVSAGIPIARLQNIKRNQFVAKNIQYVTKRKAEELMRHTFVPDDILITKLGDPLGKACLAPASIDLGVLVADVVRARLTHQWVDRRFLCYQINADYIVEQFKDQTKGTTRPRVNLTKIRALRAKLCPLKEQTRIVEKLEELLSDLDAGVAELKAAQKKLGQYRQSLLKAAVEGALTAEWREERKKEELRRKKAGDTTFLPSSFDASSLLERILLERRARWEAKQLAKFKEQGKTPLKDWQKKYPEPVQPNTTNLPELPEGWVWATIDQLAQVGTGVTPLRSKSAYFNEGTIPWVTSGALNSDTVTAATELVTELALTECRLELYPAGSLLVAMYGEGKTRGKCSELLIPATINQAIAAIVLEPEALPCKAYVKAFLLDSYDRMRAQASGGVQPNLNLQIVKSIALPLPSVDEQVEIEKLLDSQFGEITQQQVAVGLGLKQSAAQRQNILRAAFAGQLVPQDPTDEPASVLLERIRTERAAHAAVNKPRGRKVRAATA